MLETLERLILDPVTEAPPYGVTANRPIEVTGVRAPSPEGHGVFLSDHQYPRPDSTPTYASSRDSQGEARFGKPKLGNRKIPVKVYVSEAGGVGAATNLATNPAGEVLKKWVNGPDYTVLRELGGVNGIPSLSGEFRDKHSFDGSASDSNMGSLEQTMPAAGTYTFSAFIWIPSTWDGSAPVLGLEGWVGGTVEKQGQADLSKRDQWQRVVSTVKVVAGDLVGFMLFRAVTPPKSAGTGVAYTDAIQIESGSVATPYVCGDTPGCGWNGTPNASTSTRTGSGSDRKRFLRCLYDLQEKIEKLSESGGTLKRILPDGSWMVFDVVEATFVGNWEKRFNQGQEEFQFELICRPGARLAPITFTAHEEKTLPILKFVELEVPGNLPAYGDLLIEDIQGVNRNFAAVAVASRFLDQSANADVFYEAEGRARLGGSTLIAGPGIPSGSESNKVVEAIASGGYWGAKLSTRSSLGTHVSHVGAQKIIARVWLPTANIGDVSMKFEYAQGDLLRWRSCAPVVFPANSSEGIWVLVDLGVVRLNRAVLGPQRWEGRIATKSTNQTGVTDKVLIDWIAILPVEEFYGEARSLTSAGSETNALIASDLPSGVSGTALTGLTAELGGKWTGTGDADDFKLTTTAGEGVVRKPSTLDVASTADDPPAGSEIGVTGRWDRLGTGVQDAVSLSSSLSIAGVSNARPRVGIFCRYVDTNNMLLARVVRYPVGGVWGNYLEVWKRKAGTWTLLASGVAQTWFGLTFVSFSCAVDGSGGCSSTFYESKTNLSWGPDTDLATGGALATGGYGIYGALGVDASNKAGTGLTEAYVQIIGLNVYGGFSGGSDSVLYSNKDLRVRWDKTVREHFDGSGAFSEVALWTGDRLLIPPSGREQRPVRVAILTSRGVPATSSGAKPSNDLQADDLKATLTVTPRVTEVPEPS